MVSRYGDADVKRQMQNGPAKKTRIHKEGGRKHLDAGAYSFAAVGPKSEAA